MTTRPMPMQADTPDADTPPAPFQAQPRHKARGRAFHSRPNPPTQKRLADKPQAPFALPTAQPTLEARAELSLLELCLARRRKTTVKKKPMPSSTSLHQFNGGTICTPVNHLH